MLATFWKWRRSSSSSLAASCCSEATEEGGPGMSARPLVLGGWGVVEEVVGGW